MNLIRQIFSGQLIHALGWTILHSLWQIVVISVVLGFVLFLIRKKSSRLRYLVTLISFILIICWAGITFSHYYNQGGVREARELSYENNFQISSSLQTFFRYDISENIYEAYQDFLSIFNTLIGNSSIIVVIWLFGVIFFSLKLVIGIVVVKYHTKTGRLPVNQAVKHLLSVLKKKMQIRQKVKIFKSYNILTPLVTGIINPIILIPAGMLSGIPANQVEAIIAHELAHIKRFDYLVNIIQSVIEILFFYHPGVWWISKILRRERENCCDDIAVGIYDNNLTYIKALLNIEEFRLSKSNIMVAFSNNKDQLLARIKRLVTGKTQSMISPVYFVFIALLIISAFALRSTVKASPEAGLPVVNETEGTMQAGFLIGSLTASPVNIMSEIAIQIPDSVKKKGEMNNSDEELKRAIEERDEMTSNYEEKQDREEWQEKMYVSNEKLFAEIEKALGDIDFTFPEIHLPDSNDWELAREEFQRSMKEFRRLHNEEFREYIEKALKDAREAMEEIRENMKEFRSNDMERFKKEMKEFREHDMEHFNEEMRKATEEMNKVIEEMRKSHMKICPDSLDVFYYDFNEFNSEFWDDEQIRSQIEESKRLMEDLFKNEIIELEDN